MCCSSSDPKCCACAGATKSISALELPNGQLLRVDPAAVHTDFRRAMATSDNHAAAAAVLGVVAENGIAQADISMLTDHAEVVSCLCIYCTPDCVFHQSDLQSLCSLPYWLVLS